MSRINVRRARFSSSLHSADKEGNLRRARRETSGLKGCQVGRYTISTTFISWTPAMVDCPQISDLGPVLVLHQTLCCSTEMNSHFENWSDVRFFLAVFRHGSTLAASKKLGVAQPTVSRRIDALESEIGLALFDRGSRGVRPTDCAKALLASAEEMERVAEKFEQKLEQLRKPRTIRITAPGNFSEQVMDIFSAFSAKNPDVGFEFIHSIKVLDLASGEADIAIRLTKEEQDQNLICRKIRDAKWALFGSTSYSQKFGLPKSEDELGGHCVSSIPECQRTRLSSPMVLHGLNLSKSCLVSGYGSDEGGGPFRPGTRPCEPEAGKG